MADNDISDKLNNKQNLIKIANQLGNIEHLLVSKNNKPLKGVTRDNKLARIGKEVLKQDVTNRLTLGIIQKGLKQINKIASQSEVIRDTVKYLNQSKKNNSTTSIVSKLGKPSRTRVSSIPGISSSDSKNSKEDKLTPLEKARKTAQSQKKSNNTRMLGRLYNKLGESGVENLLFDSNGNELSVDALNKVLTKKERDVKAQEQQALKAKKQLKQNLPLSQQILNNKDNERVKRLNKYGQGLARKDPSGFNALTSGKSDSEILASLGKLYDSEQLQLKLAKEADDDRKKKEKADSDLIKEQKKTSRDAEKKQRDKDKDERKLGIEERKKLAEEKRNLNEHNKLLKLQQKALAEEQRERRKLFKDLVSSRGGSTLGYGGLGLAGGGIGGILGGALGLIPSAVAGIAGGAGSLLGTAGTAIGAGLGIKGLASAGAGLTGFGKNALGKSKGMVGLGGSGAKYGARAGAGVAKLGGKGAVGLARGAGGLLGKIPGLGMITKMIPGLNTVLGAGALGVGIYDAWNETDSWSGFAKEAGWNTASNLGSIATAGLIDADSIEAFGKNMSAKVESSDYYKKGEDAVKKRLYGDNYKEEDAKEKYAQSKSEYIEKYVENLNKYKENKKAEIKRYLRHGHQPGVDDLTPEGKKLLRYLDSSAFDKDTQKEFYNKRSDLMNGAGVNVSLPNFVKSSRKDMMDEMKKVSIASGNLTVGTNQTNNTNNVSNNNSVVNVHNEPVQNKTTPMAAFGGTN